MFSIGIMTGWPNLQAIGMFQLKLLAVTTSVGIVAGTLTHHRSWCQNFCPVGTLGRWMGGGWKPLKISSNCAVKCHNVCFKVCPTQIEKSQYKPNHGWSVIPEGDCLKCGLCTAVCPRGALAL
jgi:polyferredoxin